MNDAHAYLTARVLHEKQPVTYRVLSCALGIRVEEAKDALAQFADAQTEHVTPIYTVLTPHEIRVMPNTHTSRDDAHAFVYAVQPAHMPFDPPVLAAVNRALACDDTLNARREAGSGAHGASYKPAHASAAQLSETQEPRKRRKVIKKIRTKNEKGYTVFQDVETYETEDEEETKKTEEGMNARPEKPREEPAKPEKPAPAKASSAKSAKNGSAPKQHSLLSFFGKS